LASEVNVDNNCKGVIEIFKWFWWLIKRKAGKELVDY
jgi:hypothetical protein